MAKKQTGKPEAAEKTEAAPPAEEKAAGKKEKEPKKPREPKAKTAPAAPAAPAADGARAAKAAAPAEGAPVAPAPAAATAGAPGEVKKRGRQPGNPPPLGKKLKSHLQNVQQRLAKEGPLPVKRAVAVLKQLKRAK